jgi:NTE family protein
MKAYAVLSGGGVKGVMLAGCLAAAQDLGIEFEGFAGTSAGGIMATLASIGLAGGQLRRLAVEDLAFTELLDDRGRDLRRLRTLLQEFGPNFGTCWRLLRALPVVVRATRHLGLYSGDAFVTFLGQTLRAAVPALAPDGDITFEDLRRHGARPLLIVASDITRRTVRLFGAPDDSVLVAVRASMSYPVAFRPVRHDSRLLVDGGLSANLPYLLFRRAPLGARWPTLAFDLLTPPQAERRSPLAFLTALLSTGLESSQAVPAALLSRLDSLQVLPGDESVGTLSVRALMDGMPAGERLLPSVLRLEGNVFIFGVPVPPGISTLDLDLDRDARARLYEAGYRTATDLLTRAKGPWRYSTQPGRWLRALYPDRIQRTARLLLERLAGEVARLTQATTVRSYVMLPTGHGSLAVVFQSGMDGDPDEALCLLDSRGVSGTIWQHASPCYADVAGLLRHDPGLAAMLRPDRKAAAGVPLYFWQNPSAESQLTLALFDQRKRQDEPLRVPLSSLERGWPFSSAMEDDTTRASSVLPIQRLGVLMIDTDATPEQVGWALTSPVSTREQVTQLLVEYAELLAHLIGDRE